MCSGVVIQTSTVTSLDTQDIKLHRVTAKYLFAQPHLLTSRLRR